MLLLLMAQIIQVIKVTLSAPHLSSQDDTLLILSNITIVMLLVTFCY